MGKPQEIKDNAAKYLQQIGERAAHTDAAQSPFPFPLPRSQPPRTFPKAATKSSFPITRRKKSGKVKLWTHAIGHKFPTALSQ